MAAQEDRVAGASGIAAGRGIPGVWLLTAGILMLRRPATRTVARRAE